MSDKALKWDGNREQYLQLHEMLLEWYGNDDGPAPSGFSLSGSHFNEDDDSSVTKSFRLDKYLAWRIDATAAAFGITTSEFIRHTLSSIIGDRFKVVPAGTNLQYDDQLELI